MPKTEENRAILTDRQGREVALKGVSVRARLHGLMAEVLVEQSYRNPRDTNIEAVYTFPLPLGAVLLGLEVEIAGKKLAGQVVEKKQAERAYEDAVTDGNSAVMLEEAGPGLYTASLGNLMAGEAALIRYRYGLLLSWQGPRLRFLLPTTIAPRYGDAAAAGLQPHQVPASSLDVEYPLDIAVTVEGELAAAAIASPSHPITVGRVDAGLVIRLSGRPVLDRDFVLTLETETMQSSCVLTPDRDAHVALASLRIPPLPAEERKPLALKVVIDCSGSMAGASIDQARKAALEILELLRPEDSVNVTLFGNAHRHLFRSLVPASARYITEAWNLLDRLDADMGGTEMEAALNAVFAMGGAEIPPTVLLITDGEIHAHEKLVRRAAKSGHRIFTVGVGAAVAEVFLKALSNTTQGACELVSPQEGMAERVLGQFHRMRQPILCELRIDWPTQPEWQTKLPDTVFAGDTVHVFAGFAAPVEGKVTLSAAGGSAVEAAIVTANEVEIPRLAAARRMQTATEAECLRLALDYQLLSRLTNFLVIAERADKAAELPELHQLPQMLAAGWGGSGQVPRGVAGIQFSMSSAPCAVPSPRVGRDHAPAFDEPAFLRCQVDFDFPSPPPPIALVAESAHLDQFSPVADKSQRAPSPAHTAEGPAPGDAEPAPQRMTPADFILAMSLHLMGRSPVLPSTIDELAHWGLDAIVVENLRKWVTDGYTEAEVVLAFLHALKRSRIGYQVVYPAARQILKGWKQVSPNPALDREVQTALQCVTAEEWNLTNGELVS